MCASTIEATTATVLLLHRAFPCLVACHSTHNSNPLFSHLWLLVCSCQVSFVEARNARVNCVWGRTRRKKAQTNFPAHAPRFCPATMAHKSDIGLKTGHHPQQQQKRKVARRRERNSLLHHSSNPNTNTPSSFPFLSFPLLPFPSPPFPFLHHSC